MTTQLNIINVLKQTLTDTEVDLDQNDEHDLEMLNMQKESIQRAEVNIQKLTQKKTTSLEQSHKLI